MKKAILVSAMGAMGLGVAGNAAAEEVGRVISSTPVVQQVQVPRQVCNQQMAEVQRPATSGGGAIVGAIVGGLLGNTVGGGMGRAAATGVGAIAGAAVGNNLEQRDTQYASRPVTQCVTQSSVENRTVGYNVQYEYAGKTFNVQMPYDPGPTIRLSVQPATSSVTAPEGSVQTIAANPQMIVSETPSVVYPGYAYPGYAYPAYGYAPYYRPYWYPPVSLSFGYVYGGGRHWHR
ncbi:MAG TPA: glycine zipper 2TM domain-containing protein [Ramlibacter sp.]|nr:glycine zipper 2TM domain-containing protein [Ramlibacter sp.]